MGLRSALGGLWQKQSAPTEVNQCCVSLQEGQLTLALVSHGAERPTLLQYASLSAPQGLTAEVFTQLAQTVDLSAAQLGYVLSQNQYRMQLTDLPNVAAAEVRQALSWRLADLFTDHHDPEIPDPANFTFDLLPLPSAQAGLPATQGLVFGLPNRILQPLQMSFHSAGLRLRVVDVANQAQSHLSALAEPDGRGLAVLSFNAHGGLLTVTQGGALYMTRHLETSLPQLIQADDSSRVMLLERVALEVQRSLDVFDRQYQALGLSKLLLAPLPPMPGLLQTLAQNLFLPVGWFDLESLMELPASEPGWTYWPVLGAALRAPAAEAVA